jgi:hypothetical protein
MPGFLPERGPGDRDRSDRGGRSVAGVRSGARVAHRFRSVHALPLRLRGRGIGALNLFTGVPGPLPAPDLALGQALADVATIGILQERAIRHEEVLNERLQVALHSRVIIEQAKGALAQYAGLAPAVAFQQLHNHARSHNLKLAELARRIVDKNSTSPRSSYQDCAEPQPVPQPGGAAIAHITTR